MDRTDDEIIEDAISGADDSFNELVDRYTTPIYNFVFKLTGNAEHAEDITQETFIKVWKNIKKYDQKYSFKSWIFTIARNTATDFLRKKKSILFTDIGMIDDESFESTVADDAELPMESLMKLEEKNSLDKTLRQLPLDYQSVLIFHYQNDMTFDEIGKVMGKSPNTVKSWHRRALIKLRDILG